MGLPVAGLAADNAGGQEVEPFAWEEDSVLSGTFHEVPEEDAKPELFLTVILEELNRAELVQSEDGPPVRAAAVTCLLPRSLRLGDGVFFQQCVEFLR
jgi:hypothetical protein